MYLQYIYVFKMISLDYYIYFSSTSAERIVPNSLLTVLHSLVFTISRLSDLICDRILGTFAHPLILALTIGRDMKFPAERKKI